MLPLSFPLALLLILPLALTTLTTYSGPTAFVGAQLARGKKPWLIRVGQANLLILVGWLALCGGQIFARSDSEHWPFMLPFGLFLLATVYVLLEIVKRRRVQVNLREAIWWMLVFAVVAALAPARFGRPDSPTAAVMLLIGVTVRLSLLSFFASFVAVPTLVIWDRSTSLRNKVMGLLLICVTGAVIQVIVLGGLSLATGDVVGSPGQIFLQGLCLDLGILAVLTSCVMLRKCDHTFVCRFLSRHFSSV